VTRGLDRVRARIVQAAGRSGRDPGGVRLVIVGKGQDPARLRELYEHGHRDFGENRAQELAAKAEQMPADVVWHFIGPLQSNKVRVIRPVVDFLHSLDRLELATAWMKGPGLPPPAFLQINIGNEPQKQGVSPERAPQVVDALTGLGVPLLGLMAIPPIADDPERSRPYYRKMTDLLADLARSHPHLTELSMGMSDDFEVAVEEGSTCLRVGRAIFASTEH
jgi:hypothetical protein